MLNPNRGNRLTIKGDRFGDHQIQPSNEPSSVGSIEHPDSDIQN